MTYRDPIVEEVWNSREKLLEQHGGLDGFLEYIRKQEQKHPEKLIEPEQVKNKKNNKAQIHQIF